MTSQTEKKQPDSKLDSQKLLEQVAATLHYEAQQLKRTLWLAAMSSGGSLTLDESKLDLLWQLGFTRSPEGLMVVTASQIPEALPTDIEQMAKDLLGTNAPMSEYAAAHDRLKDYPIPYLEFMLSRFIRFDGTSWKDVASFVASPPPP